MYYIFNWQRPSPSIDYRRYLLVLSMIMYLLLSSPAIASDDEVSLPRLQGTFIQLLSHHGGWEASDWRELFVYFDKLRLSQVIIQWSVIDDIAFYPSTYYQHLPNHPLEIILKLADEYKIDVFIGLAYDTQYWTKVGGGPQALEAYFKYLYERSSRVATELSPLAMKHPSFQGWYIVEEVDDINWRSAEPRQVLFKYLEKLTKRLHAITPDKEVALSGFSNGTLSPADFQSFWRTLLVSANIDVVLFQDGIGVNKLQMDNLPRYLEAINKAASEAGAELQAIIETFTQVAGTPIDEQPFRAIPAPLERIIRQLLIAAKYSEKYIAFSVPEYMTPKGGLKAEQLYKRYTADFSDHHERQNRSEY